ncbi:MAG: PrgI family protein [Patescibacteria group bacterium]
MQFQIPQFIETEDKIAGPLTLKQLLYLTGAGALSFVSFFILKFWLWLIITVFLSVVASAFSFIKYNGQPLIKIVYSAFRYFWNPRLYLWKREIKPQIIEISEEKVLTERKKLKESFTLPSIKKLWTEITTRKTPIPKREKVITVKPKKESIAIFRKITGEKETARRVDYR